MIEGVFWGLFCNNNNFRSRLTKDYFHNCVVRGETLKLLQAFDSKYTHLYIKNLDAKENYNIDGL